MEFLRDFLSRSLERKFVFFIVAMVAIAMVSVGYVTTGVVRKLVTDAFQTRVSIALAAGLQAWETSPTPRNIEQIRRGLSAFRLDESLEGLVYLSSDASAPPQVLQGVVPAGVALGPRVLSAAEPLMLYPGAGGENYVGWTMRTRDGGGVLAIYSKATMESFLFRMNVDLLEVAAVVGILSCFLGLFMARLILRPIERFITAMRLIAEGQEIGQLTTLDRNELGEWTKTFNLMIEQLRHKHLLQLFLVNREKNELVMHIASGLAHRIRTPLTAINSLTQLITRGGDVRKLKEWTAVILAKVKELDEAVSQFVTYARPVPLVFAVTRLSEQLALALDLLGPTLQEAKIELSRELRTEREEPQLMDGPQLQQAFIQLLRNSARAMPQGGRLSVSLSYREGDQGAVMTLHDTGEPVPPELRDRIFEPFVDLTNRHGSFGLSVAARLIELHGGDIFLQTPPDGGNCYVLTLPRLSLDQLKLRSAQAEA
ncbi:MAG: HAMP domain-containing histidine kinase [Candidatus Wallbacteria bacterium]|nr:HAMP domain-containing histidine kinase [Candidatus Wallbacteria bacterium]